MCSSVGGQHGTLSVARVFERTATDKSDIAQTYVHFFYHHRHIKFITKQNVLFININYITAKVFDQLVMNHLFLSTELTKTG